MSNATGWQPIETAPKDIVRTSESSEYGRHLLLFPFYGEAVRGRWWQSADAKARAEGYRNFLADGGRSFRPTHWMPLPDPPEAS